MSLKKLNSIAELNSFYEDLKGLLDIKRGKATVGRKVNISVCGGTGCHASQSEKIKEELIKYAKQYRVDHMVDVSITGCFGFCEKGPIVKISPDHTFYIKIKPENAERIIKEHVVEGKLIEEFLYIDPNNNQRIVSQENIPFYKKQHRVALRNCGFIDPEYIQEYIANKGFLALAKVLSEMSPTQVIDEMKKSGLRGRGGGGFLTGLKWEFASKYQSEKKYVICNADEGDPGAFMDRSILEGDPYSVIEAMIIAGYAIGADEGNVYIRAEYPLAIERLSLAIAQARKLGLLGKNILGTKFSFDIFIKYGAGAFVCGEETALISSIEGNRGEPNVKPPFPAEAGLFKKPTIVNNVETLANIPVIILDGAEEFAKVGTEKSKGTKVFALAGKINNVGLVEVPMGTTLREVIYDIGGGIKDGHEFKAAQTGGPSGGCITAENLDTPIDFDNLSAIGSMMGSGGLIIMDDRNCMVDIAKFYLEFTVEESCGKCTPCRIGNKRLLEILTRITEGEGTLEDVKKLEVLSDIIKDTALCGLGQSAPNPVLSTLKYFKDEYLEHVEKKYCRSKVCRALSRYEIVKEQCVGCGNCARNCPVGAISKTDQPAKNPKLFLYEIDPMVCIRCGACEPKCPLKAIKL